MQQTLSCLHQPSGQGRAGVWNVEVCFALSESYFLLLKAEAALVAQGVISPHLSLSGSISHFEKRISFW